MVERITEDKVKYAQYIFENSKDETRIRNPTANGKISRKE
jgi:hypothetical protein